jgi:hypothetical protein
MGTFGMSKILGWMGFKEHFHLLKTIGCQSMLDTFNNYQPLVTSGGPQV